MSVVAWSQCVKTFLMTASDRGWLLQRKQACLGKSSYVPETCWLNLNRIAQSDWRIQLVKCIDQSDPRIWLSISQSDCCHVGHSMFACSVFCLLPYLVSIVSACTHYWKLTHLQSNSSEASSTCWQRAKQWCQLRSLQPWHPAQQVMMHGWSMPLGSAPTEHYERTTE
jgi:hypothetical protein